MNASLILIHIAGDVALLLWGVHMVSSGVLRAYGDDLRQLLVTDSFGRGRAFMAGMAITVLLQSSTATALMASSLSPAGAAGLVQTLAVILGAGVGSTIIVQLLAFDASAAFPPLVILGLITFRSARTKRFRELGRIAIGLGLILLSLRLIVQAIAPIGQESLFAELIAQVTDDYFFLAAIAMALAVAAHSGVAVMLVIVALAGHGVLGVAPALAMVIGVNVGSAINPLIEASRNDPVRLRPPLGNMVVRLIAAAIAIALIEPAAAMLSRFDSNPARVAADFHLLFNLALAALFLPLLPAAARFLRTILPDPEALVDPGKPRHLHAQGLEIPAVALANAEREILRMADVVESMLARACELILDGDREKIALLRRTDDVLDNLHIAIIRYLTSIDGRQLNPTESARLNELVRFATNLEHIGDVIDQNLMKSARKRLRLRVRFDESARAAIQELQMHLKNLLRLAAAILMSREASAARQLIEAREDFRKLEKDAVQRHLIIVREDGEAVANSMFLDLVRDLERIESHITATAVVQLELEGDAASEDLSSA